MRNAQDAIMRIFLWFLFIVLSLFLAFWLYNMYQQYIVSGTIEKGTIGTLGCSGYTFKVFDINYDDDELSFVIKNTIGDTIKVIEIKSETGSIKENLGALGSGREMRVVMPNFKIKSNFVVYPEGCLRYNSKEFKKTESGWVKLSAEI